MLITSTRPPTRKLASSKCTPLETIQLRSKTFLATRNNNVHVHTFIRTSRQWPDFKYNVPSVEDSRVAKGFTQIWLGSTRNITSNDNFPTDFSRRMPISGKSKRNAVTGARTETTRKDKQARQVTKGQTRKYCAPLSQYYRLEKMQAPATGPRFVPAGFLPLANR